MLKTCRPSSLTPLSSSSTQPLLTTSEIITDVAFVLKKNAKLVKDRFEEDAFVDKKYRITAVGYENADQCYYQPLIYENPVSSSGCSQKLMPTAKQCVAIPVTQSCRNSLQSNDHLNKRTIKPFKWIECKSHIVGVGKYACSYSAAFLASQNFKSQVQLRSVIKQHHLFTDNTDFTIPQLVLLKTLLSFENTGMDSNNQTCIKNSFSGNYAGICITSIISQLSRQACPKTLELFGDDNTLVLPQKAFSYQEETFQIWMNKFVVNCLPAPSQKEEHTININEKNNNTSCNQPTFSQKCFLQKLYENFALAYKSCRVIRKMDISPESGVRKSNNVIIWFKGMCIETEEILSVNNIDYHSNKNMNEMLDINHNTNVLGPDSTGWITVTEQGILQSFDLTKVMFSRGNISEKIRFGNLVQAGDQVLDMYAGIGYFSLPALVHGKAKHVYCCEWNPDAVFALKYNLKQNGVANRATVLAGDVRTTLMEHQSQCLLSPGKLTTNKDCEMKTTMLEFDRISLGLLPSSEGGWSTAVRFLRKDVGGWLHIHGNVPTLEKESWALWVCKKLYKIASIAGMGSEEVWGNDFVILCHYVERVKSYAPNIEHFVADIFLGPRLPYSLNVDMNRQRIGIIQTNGLFLPCPEQVKNPSCALGGVLHQQWMINSQ